MNKKFIFVFVLILLFLGIIITLYLCMNKNINTGNNIINKSTSEIVNTILNMKTYSAKISVNVVSNKNEHIYLIEQKCIEDKKYKQEVIEPENIRGTIINYDGNKLEITNTKLNLSKIYENYPYLAKNNLLLNYFIEEYKMDKYANYTEDTDEIIMSTRNYRKK